MTKMICKNTLVFRNLPPELSDAEKQDFLVHFGAKTVKIITSKYRQKCRAFAKFESEEHAKNILYRLHQMTVLGARLCVEYAQEEIGCDKLQTNFNEGNSEKHFTAFLNKLNSWNNAVSFNQPPPPHLKYSYPKANRATINNIAHALATVPKFYTQVLHLMNRMNLPPPFSNIPDPPPQAIPQPSTIVQNNSTPQPIQTSVPPKSSSESEYESDPDEIDQRIKDIIPEKRKMPQKKAIKKPKFVKPPIVTSAVKPTQNREEVFEKINLQNQKKIEVKVSDNLEPKEETSEVEMEGFGIIPSQKPKTSEESTIEKEEPQNIKVITEEELASNRISPKDFRVLPVFKDYHAGAPSCRLYIKNLAKTVDVKDLEYIYKRYDIPPADNEQGNMFDIRLMQEGRMKGQAFVTLQSVALAQKAVKETNGFILKNKPLVVLFARSAVPKTK